MWLHIEKTKEWIPFDAEHTAKVYFDGKNGWAIKQKDGNVYHVPEEYYEKRMLRELDSELYWNRKQIEDAAKGLSPEEIKKLRKILKGKEDKED